MALEYTIEKQHPFCPFLFFSFFFLKKNNAEVNVENPSDQLETVKNLYREYFAWLKIHNHMNSYWNDLYI